jgi:hypothetical protein
MIGSKIFIGGNAPALDDVLNEFLEKKYNEFPDEFKVVSVTQSESCNSEAGAWTLTIVLIYEY